MIKYFKYLGVLMVIIAGVLALWQRPVSPTPVNIGESGVIGVDTPETVQGRKQGFVGREWMRVDWRD